MSVTRPKPVRRFVPLEQLAFLPGEYQHRGEPFNEAHVLHLLEALEAGETFDPLDVVEIAPTTKQKKVSLNVVIDGFNRGEAYRRKGVVSVECNVYQGSEADAKLWSLSSNSKQPLQRTPEDCQRAFTRLLESPSLLYRVIEESRGKGGTERGIARACGLSMSIVGKYLHARGVKADRVTGKLIPVEAKVSPEIQARVDLCNEMIGQGKTIVEAARELGMKESSLASNRRTLARAGEKGQDSAPASTSPARAKPEADTDTKTEGKPAPTPTVAAVDGDAMHAAVRDALAAMQKDIRGFGRAIESLLKSTAGDALRVAAKARGVPFEVKEKDRAQHINDTATVKVESWPLLGTFQAVLADVAASLIMGKSA